MSMDKDKVLTLRKYYKIPNSISDKQIEKDLDNSFCSAMYNLEIEIKKFKDNFLMALPECINKYFI